MSERCKQAIITDSFPDQCSRKAVRDGLCNYHNPEVQKEKEAKKLFSSKARAERLLSYKLAIKRAEKAEHQRDALLTALKESYESKTGDAAYEAGCRAMKLIAEIEGSHDNQNK